MKQTKIFYDIERNNISIVSNNKFVEVIISIYLYIFVQKAFGKKYRQESFGTININIYKADKRNPYVTKFTDIICSLSYQKSVFGLDILPFNFLRDNPLYTDKKQQEFNDCMDFCDVPKTFNKMVKRYIVLKNGI